MESELTYLLYEVQKLELTTPITAQKLADLIKKSHYQMTKNEQKLAENDRNNLWYSL